MKKHYITPNFIFVIEHNKSKLYGHLIESSLNGMLTFKADIYKHDKSEITNSLCGKKIKDQVLVSIPISTPSTIF